jgi:hypothetical protein
VEEGCRRKKWQDFKLNGMVEVHDGLAELSGMTEMHDFTELNRMAEVHGGLVDLSGNSVHSGLVDLNGTSVHHTSAKPQCTVGGGAQWSSRPRQNGDGGALWAKVHGGLANLSGASVHGGLADLGRRAEVHGGRRCTVGCRRSFCWARVASSKLAQG